MPSPHIRTTCKSCMAVNSNSDITLTGGNTCTFFCTRCGAIHFTPIKPDLTERFLDIGVQPWTAEWFLAGLIALGHIFGTVLPPPYEAPS